MKISAFTKTYDGRCVLRFPGIDLERGRVYCIIGANGSGKSTFARVLSGMINADQRGNVLEGSATVGCMPQKNYAFRMRVQANVLLGNGDVRKAQALMEDLQLTHLAAKRADHLSGGETARMALARLMMRAYDLVILDEPTAAMDVETTLLAEQRIRRYVQETNCALILITHSLRQARRLADDVLFFHSGALVESGPRDAVLEKPIRPETRQFLDFYGA